jgi:hypothetical protein
MLKSEIIAANSKPMQNTNMHSEGTAYDFLNIKPGGKYSNHWALKDWSPWTTTLILAVKCSKCD